MSEITDHPAWLAADSCGVTGPSPGLRPSGHCQPAYGYYGQALQQHPPLSLLPPPPPHQLPPMLGPRALLLAALLLSPAVRSTGAPEPAPRYMYMHMYCSDWQLEAPASGAARQVGQAAPGGPSHCVCPGGKTKEQLPGSTRTDWGWHCAGAPAPAPGPSGAACEFDAICSHCRGAWWPVCGVDGQTYSSECRAACTCVAVAIQGACDGWGVAPTSRRVVAPSSESRPTPEVSAKVDIDRADGTHTSYLSGALAAAAATKTNTERMKALQEHAAAFQAKVVDTAQQDEHAAIPSHLQEWSEPTCTGADTDREAAADGETACDGGTCPEQHTAAPPHSVAGGAVYGQAKAEKYGKPALESAAYMYTSTNKQDL